MARNTSQAKLSDIAFIANFLGWKLNLLFGAIIWLFFHEFIPWLAMERLQFISNDFIRQFAPEMFARKIVWFERFGNAAVIICVVMAAKNFGRTFFYIGDNRLLADIARFLGKRIE